MCPRRAFNPKLRKRLTGEGQALSLRARLGAGLERDFGLGVLTLLAIRVNRLGFGFGGVVAFSTGLVGFGRLVFLGALAFEGVLGAFHKVVGGFLHGFGGFFYEGVVDYGIGSVGGQVLHLISSGRGGVGCFGEEAVCLGFGSSRFLYTRLFFSASVAGADSVKRDFSSSKSTFFSTGVRSKFLILRVSLLARAMFLRCLRFRRVTDMISGEMRVLGGLLANEVQK